MVTRTAKGGTKIVNSFKVDNNKVAMMADPPHLLKNLRNALLREDFILDDTIVAEHSLPSNRVSLKAIKALIEFQADREYKLAPHLSSKGLSDNSFDKMKVDPAKYMLSHETGQGHPVYGPILCLPKRVHYHGLVL